MQRRFGEILEDEDQIELLETILDTFQGSNLDFRKGDDEERSVSKVNKALRGGLKADAGSERNTLERQLTEGNVELKGLAELCNPKMISNETRR